MSLLKRVGGGQPAEASSESPAKVAIPVRGGSDNGLPTTGTAVATLPPPTPITTFTPLPQRETVNEARSKVQDRIIAELDQLRRGEPAAPEAADRQHRPLEGQRRDDDVHA